MTESDSKLVSIKKKSQQIHECKISIWNYIFFILFNGILSGISVLAFLVNISTMFSLTSKAHNGFIIQSCEEKNGATT